MHTYTCLYVLNTFFACTKSYESANSSMTDIARAKNNLVCFTYDVWRKTAVQIALKTEPGTKLISTAARKTG